MNELNCGLELRDLINERGEVPQLIGIENASHDAMRLYRFPDGVEVIETNAGIFGEDEGGFYRLSGIQG